jgi:hypothetical protein
MSCSVTSACVVPNRECEKRELCLRMLEISENYLTTGKQSGVLHGTKPESKTNVIMVSHVYHTAPKVCQFSNRNYIQSSK